MTALMHSLETAAPGPGRGAASPAHDPCPNCGVTLGDRFCGHCGQKRPDRSDLTMRAMLAHAFDEVLSADSKLVATIRSMFVAPGELARDWFEGRRARWIAPLRMYLVLSALYYIGAYDLTQDEMNQPMFEVIGKTMRDTKIMAPDIAIANARAHFEFLSTAVSFTGVLMQALVARLALRRTGRTYVEHLVAMLYATAATWLLSTVVMLGWWWFAHDVSPLVPTLLLSAASFGYLVLLLHRAHRLTWVTAATAGAAIFVVSYASESFLLSLLLFFAAFVPG